jgi:integrase
MIRRGRTVAEWETRQNSKLVKRQCLTGFSHVTVYLCREACALLEALPHENEQVLGGWLNPQDAYSDLRKSLPALKGTTLHDLRHTFISTGDDLGISPATIGALVGHAAKTQTGRYTHKLSPELAEAAQRIGGHLAALLGH